VNLHLWVIVGNIGYMAMQRYELGLRCRARSPPAPTPRSARPPLPGARRMAGRRRRARSAGHGSVSRFSLAPRRRHHRGVGARALAEAPQSEAFAPPSNRPASRRSSPTSRSSTTPGSCSRRWRPRATPSISCACSISASRPERRRQVSPRFDAARAIAKAALTPSGAPSPPRAYVAQRLHLYMTTSNLRGTPYFIPFTGGKYG